MAVALGVSAAALPAARGEEAASQQLAFEHGLIDAGNLHTCAVLTTGRMRCWGAGISGRLGYASTASVGDNETPASAGPVDLGSDRTATSISAGGSHTCALLDSAQVRCWGEGLAGQLGYSSTASIGDNETPASAGPVDLGADRTATSISAGGSHTCAVLDTGRVSCWGNGGDGRLGYANTNTIGNNEAPASAGPVDLGAGRTARAISAGNAHTCALLDAGDVRCWGYGDLGRLGYASTENIGDNETPASAGTVDVGAGRTARAISAGGSHTCALLDSAQVRCWGDGSAGQLGYGNTDHVGDDETPASAGTVDLGAGRTALAIAAGSSHTCALLDDGDVRCWGDGAIGQLGYSGTGDIGDNETPGSAGPVDLGAERTAQAITAGTSHTCALLDSGQMRCWGQGIFGQLGYASTANIGDNETPAAAGPVDLAGLVTEPVPPPPPPLPPPPPPPPAEPAAPAPPPPPAAPAPPPAPPPAVVTPKPARPGVLTLRAGSRAGTITVTGTLKLPPGARCAGKVAITVKRGTKRVARKSIALRTRSGRCGYSARLRPRRIARRAKLRIGARFTGTSALLPRSSATRTIRL